MSTNFGNLPESVNRHVDHSQLNHPVASATELDRDADPGWAAVAKSIREVDEDKIRDYKEDIDTILDFAGLFSAVLSALLAESFMTLQPDPNKIMVKLLAQVVVQTHSYSLTDGNLTSNALPLDLDAVQAFTPSLAARRVNVLWFASLTLSLVSASFGILVKQWLREYLAGEYISPQARLRIRHFRTPALNNWGVFAIAALLPLVLQLALALFFIGSCFFTMDVDSSIGYTTISLVYTSTPSRHKLLRKTLFRVVWALRGFADLPEVTKWPIVPSWSWWILGYNESDAAKDTREDMNILVAVDASQTDDRLVVKVCSALIETDAPSHDILDFVTRAVNFRLQRQIATRPFPPMLDFSQLSAQTCTIFMDAIAHALAREIRSFAPSEPIPWSTAARDCLFLLVARQPVSCRLSARAAAVVASCLKSAKPHRAAGTCALLFRGTRWEDRAALCLHLQSRLQMVFDHLDAYEAEVTMWQLLLQSCCTCAEATGRCDSTQSIFRKHMGTMPFELRQQTCTLLTSFLLRQVQMGVSWDLWHRTIMLCMSSQWAALNDTEPCEWYPALSELVRLLATQPQYAQHFHRHLYDAGTYSPVVVILFQKVIQSRDAELTAIALHKTLSMYLADKLQLPALLDCDFYLTLLWFIMTQNPSLEWLVQHFRSLTFPLYIPLWRRIWATLHIALRGFDPAIRTPAHTEWAKICLKSIDTLDNLTSPPTETVAGMPRNFEVWTQTFNTRNSFFDDDIIEDLMLFLPQSETIASTSWRVRRIISKQRQTLSSSSGQGAGRKAGSLSVVRKTSNDKQVDSCSHSLR